MTLTFLTDENNDLYLDVNGNLAMGRGVTAVQALCKFAANAQLGEMIYETNRGIPNFQVVWVGNPNIAQFEAALRRTLLAVPDVTGISNISISQTGSILNYSAVINTIYGAAVVNGTV